MPPKGPSKPKTFKYDGRLYLLPESGATALHELRPGDFIADLKSYNPVLANVEAKRIIIGQAFNTLLVAKCGSNTTQHARQIHDEWSRKLTDHLRSQRNKVNVKPQSQSIPPVVSGPGQRKKQKGNRQPSAIIGGQSWFIPDGNKFRLDQFSLLAFTKTFIDLNPARRIQDFASDLLIEACEVFVVSQYPTASAKKKKAALERRDSQAPKFLKSHDKRLRDAARVDERRTSAAVSQETKDARAKASSKAVTEESSDDTSSNTEGGRHDNCESSAGEQSQDSGESNSETGSEDGDNESRADEESQEQHESSEDDESMAEDVNTRKRRRETTPSPSDTSDSQSSHANPQDIVSAKQNNNVTPGTRRTVKRARITPVSSSESSEDARYDSSGVRLSPIPQSPKLQHVMVPKDESLALQSSSSDDEPSDDGLYGPGRDIFSALEDWLSSVS